MKIKKGISVFICLCVLICVFVFPQMFDRIFLFEKWHPNYWENLSSPTVYTVDEAIDETYESPVNLAVRQEEIAWPQGLTVDLLGDGSYQIFGEYHGEDTYVMLTSSNQFLPVGWYTLSCGDAQIDWNTFAFYFEVYHADGTVQIFASLPEETEFYIEHIYYGSMDICICIKDGFQADGLILKPMITLVREDGFAAMMRDGKTAEIAVYEANQEDLSEEDWKLFERTVSSRYNNYLWNSVLFSDGTGVQYCADGTKKTGLMDAYGRVKQTDE